MTVIALPSQAVSKIDFGQISNTQIFTSPLNNSTQTAELVGAQWSAKITLVDRTRAQWAIWSAFLAQLRGASGRCTVSPLHAAAPQGLGGGSPLVSGANQIGTTLVVKNGPLSKTGWLKVGDYFSFVNGAGVNEMHILVGADVNTDGAGNATLVFEPPIRSSPTANAPVTIASPVCQMRLIDDSQGEGTFTPPSLGAYEFQFIESWT